MASAAQELNLVFSQLHIHDPLVTQTSKVQDETAELCLAHLKGTEGVGKGGLNAYGLPKLLRDYHAEYLHESLLLGDFPVPFDAVRPWLLYWALSGLAVIGEDVTCYRERYG